QRFLLEARALARVEHQGVVRIHEVIETPGVLAIAMELVDGVPLSVLVERLRDAVPAGRPSIARVEGALGTPAGSLPDRDFAAFAARLGAELADALAAVHEAGLVHRDVKPSNVLVDRRGRARLADFGVVRDPGAALTRTGGFVGTAPYAAPEQ